MSEGLNKVFLLGNLGQDPELRMTQGGRAVMTIRMATSRTWRDRESHEQKEKTEWHTVIVWGRRAEALNKILSKGSRIHVEGELETQKYDDREGITRYRTSIIASNIILAGGTRRIDDRNQPTAPDGQHFGRGEDEFDDDIPF